MNPKTIVILTSCSFFIAAISFILFAVSLDTVWLIMAVIALVAGVLLRKIFSGVALLGNSLTSQPSSREQKF